MPVPIDRIFDRQQLERRVNRDVADQLAEAIDGARLALVDAFGGPFAFDLDVNDQPIIATNAERIIDRALAPLWALQDEFNRKGGRE